MQKILLLSTLVYSSFALALTGDEVIEIIKKQNKGFGTETSEMVLVLKEGNSVIAERKMKTKNMESEGDISMKSLMEFTHPMDVKGTKLLSWLQTKEEKSQWVYLPALNKSRRILSSGQNSSFMGSEFTYEDIGGQDTTKHNYKLLSETKDGKDLIWKVEQRSKDSENKDYQVLTIKKSLSAPTSIEYYNGKKEKMKVSTISDFKMYEVNKKQFHRPNLISMKNLITAKESSFKWEKREFGQSYKDSDFTPQALDMKR
ncbi:MAG: outer membrane lipoprotein-sorting protein [Bacteriovoracaceae bacterium]